MERNKIVPDIDVDTKDEILPQEVLEDIVNMLLDKLNIHAEYHKGYKSSSWYDPDEPAEYDVEVTAYLPLSKIREKYIVTQDTLELIKDAFYNLDCYEGIEDSINEAVSDELPSFYTINSSSISIVWDGKEQGFSLSYEIDDYDFDEGDMEDYYAPEYESDEDF